MEPAGRGKDGGNNDERGNLEWDFTCVDTFASNYINLSLKSFHAAVLVAFQEYKYKKEHFFGRANRCQPWQFGGKNLKNRVKSIGENVR